MAINYSISFTFVPATTISSSEVNTNFSDNASTWQGLEAGTKSFAQLKVDADPTTALQLTTKQYVDHYSVWRRPVLQFASASTITVESGLDGTSGNIPILFPDGSVRTANNTTHTTFNITRNAVLTTSGAQSGLRTTLSEATNTWYALYAVKVTDSSTLWVTVGDTLLPIRANYSTINTNFGTLGWVYLGLIRNGDNSGATGNIIDFAMSNNFTVFRNQCTGSAVDLAGTRLATSASSSALTYSYAAGTGATDVPNNIAIVQYGFAGTPGTNQFMRVFDSGGSVVYDRRATGGAGSQVAGMLTMGVSNGLQVAASVAGAADITLAGFYDGVLGVGSNPLL